MTSGEEQAPQRASRRRQRATRTLGWVALGAIACAILLLTAALFALPALEHRPQLLARWLGEYFAREVTLREFELVWDNGAPLLRIRDLEFAPNDDSGNVFSLDTAEVRVDLMRSIRERSIRPRTVTVRGARITVWRDANDSLTVAGIGQQRTASVDKALTNLLAAFPADAVLGIEQATVTVRGFDANSNAGQPLVLYPVNAHLHNDGASMIFSANAALQDSPQTPIRSTVRWRDHASSPLTASEFTISAQALPISALPPHWRPPGLEGQVSIAVEGQMADRAVQTMRGTLSLDRIGVAHQSSPLPITAIKGLLEYVHTDVDWQLSLLRLETNSAQALSPPSTLTVSGNVSFAPRALTLDHLPVNTFLAVLRLVAPASETLTRIAPLLSSGGRIENLQLDLTGGLSSMRLQQLSMQVRNVTLQSERHHLQMGPLNASLVARERDGSVTVHAATPIGLDLGANEQGKARTARFAAAGTLRWQRDENELVVDTDSMNLANGDLRMQVTGTLRIPDAPDAISVDFHLRGAALDEPSFKRYLALELLPARLTKWLSRAIVSGRLRNFSAHITGSPTSAVEILELLELEASFENTTLRYLDSWPELTAMSGQFALSGKQVSFNVDDARVSDARIVSTQGQISDILDAHPILELQGQASGRAEHGAAFISNTPLARKFSPLMQQLSAKGKAVLALNLTIPLSNGAVDVRGELKISDNELKIHTLRSALSAVDGAIAFDADGLTEAALKAHYLEHQIDMSLDGMLDKRKKTRLIINGATDPQGLLRHLYDVGALDSDEPSALPLLGRLSGRTNWQVTMDLAHPTAGDPIVTMSVQSDLKGMALDLPPPLGKSMHESRPLTITSTLLGTSSRSRRFQVRYGDALHAVLEMDPQQPRGFTLKRGVLQLGDGDAVLTSQQGISVRGSVALISVDEWAALIAELEAQPGTTKQTESPMDRLQRVQVYAQKMVALGAVFNDVTLLVSRTERGPWRITTKGTGIDGTISIAEPIGHTPIDARFERLHVRGDSTMRTVGESTERISIEPGSLPSARVVVQRLRYNDVELGLAKLVLEPAAGGLALREIFALNDAFEIQGTGLWQGPAKSARSRFELRLNSNDFGQFTQAFGYGDSGIEGGVAEITINATWNGSPFAFALDQIQGELRFRGTGGRLREVEPGMTGRVFGLLNLSVLPRRLLLLDFKDLFEQGVSYELIEGSFALSGGNALTEDVVMQTQTAQVELKGRVGLVAQDYDQVMTVTPKLSASLPLAPIWLAEKLLNRKLIDNAFAYRYIITGTWADPQVERVRVEVPITETQ